MKLRNFLFMGALSVLALGACTPNADDNSEWNDGTQPVSFTSYIQGVNSRAVNNAWGENDQIGISVKQSGAFGDVVNKHYLVSNAGSVSAASANDAIYYPEDGSTVDFVAYYPYTAAIANNMYAVNLTDQSSQAAIDLLYSMNATQKDKTTATPVQLTFKHQLAKIVLNITKEATIPTLAGLQVAVIGTKTKASFALLDGTLTPDGVSTLDIAAKVNDGGTLAEAIVLPVAGLTGGQISFTLGGKTQVWNIPAGQDFAAGSKITYPVTIKEEGGQISVSFGDASITDWITVNGGDIDIDFGEGGGEVDPPTPGGEVKTIFEETFGTPAKDGNFWPNLDKYTGWDNENLTFSDPLQAPTYSEASIRSTSTMDGHVWLPAAKNCALNISGINTTGYTTLVLSYDITANAAADQNIIKVTCGEMVMTVPSFSLTQNAYNHVELTGLPDNITSIQFTSDMTTNTKGYRIDNVKLIGTTK